MNISSIWKLVNQARAEALSTVGYWKIWQRHIVFDDLYHVHVRLRQISIESQFLEIFGVHTDGF